MKKLWGLVLLLLALPAFAQSFGEDSSGIMLKNAGTNLGQITSLNCSTNTNCSRSGPAGTLTSSVTPDIIFVVSSNNSTTPNTQIDFSFTSLYVGTNAISQTSTKTINAAVNGANGLDTGSLANSTWYYVYAITNATGTSIQGLVSASATSPTMPANFTSKRLFSTYRTDGSAHFYAQYQQDHQVFYNLDDTSANQVLNGGIASSFAAVDCSSFIPPLSRTGYFATFILASFSGAGTVTLYVRPTGSTLVVGTLVAQIRRVITSSVNETMDTWLQFPVSSAQSIDYLLNFSSVSNKGAYITVAGYNLSF